MKKLILAGITLALISCKSNQENVDVSINDTASNQTQIDFWKDYEINNSLGTKTTVELTDSFRVMNTNSLPNHKTGEFPRPGNPNTISEQIKTYKFPLNPVLGTESVWAREPGVALNGIKFEPETAERFICESGEVYKIEAIQNLVDLGLDFNHAHVQPTGAYHYHGVPVELIKELDKGDDVLLIGFAHDGFPMYYSKSGKYRPSFRLSVESRTGDACSYTNPETSMKKEIDNTTPDGIFVSDWIYEKGLGQLDECNGIIYNGSYAYFVTDEYPYVGRCLKGVYKKSGAKKGPRPEGGHAHPPKNKPTKK